jgi:hypothetical protein
LTATPAPTPEHRSADTPQKESATKGRRGWISLRAMLLAFLLAPLTAWWAADQVVDVIFSLMIPPVMMTFVVAMANLCVRRVAPRYALTEGELIIFYGMHTVMCALCAEWMTTIQPYIHSYALYAENDTRFDKHVNPFTHPWFFIQKADAAKFTDYRNGGFTLPHIVASLHLWWPYIASWTVLVTLVCLAMLCLNSLMRDEWTNREKLAFPIIQLPMAIVQAGAGKSKVFRSKYFLIPFVLMFLIDMVNGLHFLYPSIPLINLRFLADLKDWFAAPPWNQIGWTPIGVFPYMAVIGFFMPTDLLFSCIFFFFFRKLMQVFTYSIGYTESAGTFGGGGLVPGPPYFSEQSWGAFLALFVTALWVARNYLKEVWRQILRGHPKGDTGVPHRVAFAGLLLSLAGLGGICVIVGIPLYLYLISIGLFLAFSFALTRMRAQIGAPSHEMAFMGPTQLIVDFGGTNALPQAGVSRMVTMFHLMNRIHRTHPMPHQLEAMKMGDAARINQRALFIAILLATIAGSVLGHLCYIYKGYRFAAPRAGGETAGVVATLMDQHRPPNAVAMLFVGIGFGFVLMLDFIRFRVPGFPLHPAGYALAMNFGLDYFWFGLIIVWIIKMFVERYYGLKGHGRLHEVALGIILAEFCAEAIWATYAMINRQATYSVSINGRLGWNQ